MTARRVGQALQALVLGGLLGVAALQAWALLRAAPVLPKDGMADKAAAEQRTFRYQAY